MSWDKVTQDIESGPLGAFKWTAIFIISLVLVVAGISFILKPAIVAVESAIFKNSFQYNEGMEQRAAILEANIAEIEGLLIINPEDSENLNAQKRALNAQLNAIRKY